VRAALFVLLLAGCASAPPAPPVRVLVPSYVSCVKGVPPRPAFEVDQLAADASDGTKVLALARDLPRWLKYEAVLLAVVEGCK
jgi:hypothetical protein